MGKDVMKQEEKDQKAEKVIAEGNALIKRATEFHNNMAKDGTHVEVNTDEVSSALAVLTSTIPLREMLSSIGIMPSITKRMLLVFEMGYMLGKEAKK